MLATVTNRIHLQDPPPDFGQAIRQRLTIENPKFLENERMGRWNGRTPRFLRYYTEADNGLLVPRGTGQLIKRMANDNGISLDWMDRTRQLPETNFKFFGDLRPYQEAAVKAIRPRRNTVLESATGSGKTAMALWMTWERQQQTLVIVHTKTLMEQWKDRINQFLGIPAEEVGMIGGGKCYIRPITVATVQSLYKIADEAKNHFGHVIVDEVHHCPSRQMTEALAAFDARYILGLSATPFRRDGLTPLIGFFVGPTAYRIEQKELTQAGAILPFKVRWVETDYQTRLDASEQYSKVLSELTQDPDRNRLICSETARHARNGGGFPLVLSDRKAHCSTLAETLDRDFNIKPLILTGDLNKTARARTVEKLNAGKCNALVATAQLVGEGFDLPALGAVLLASPMKFKGRLIQAIGRGLRPAPGQDHATVIDFVDRRVGVLAASAKARARTYREAGAIQ